MDVDRSDLAVAALRRVMAEEGLTEVQRLVLNRSWAGASYAEIAEAQGYDHDYIRRVGSELWRELSKRLGIEITKRNLPEIVGGLVPNVMLVAAEKPPYPGGPMSPGSPFYVAPPGLDHALGEIEQPGGLVRIKAPAKTGKTSAALRLIEGAEERSLSTVFLDLSRVEEERLVDIDLFLRWLAASVSDRLRLDPQIERFWNDQIGCKVSCAHYLEDHVLGSLDGPLLIALDGVERLFEHPHIASEFLPFVRSCFEEARHRPEMARLRWIMAYSTEIYVPIDVRHSPFNVGYPIELPDFDISAIQRLARSYGLDWDTARSQGHAEQLAAETGGHPFLVQIALFELTSMAARSDLPLIPLGRILEQAGAPNGIFAAHLQRLLAAIVSSPDLDMALTSVLNGAADTLDPTALYRLESLGLIRRTPDGVALRCPVYEGFFRGHLE